MLSLVGANRASELPTWTCVCSSLVFGHNCASELRKQKKVPSETNGVDVLRALGAAVSFPSA